MINISFIGFSKSFLCRGNKNFSILSEYLFEIYLEDFSLYFNELSLKYNQDVFFSNAGIQSFPLFISPLKFSKVQLFFNLKECIFISYNNFYLSYLSRHTFNFFRFKRHIDLIRYKYNVLVFFSGSKKFCIYIKRKIFSFVKSILHFDILESVTRLFFINICLK